MSWRALLADVRPLRSSKAFRDLWVGSSVGLLGGQMANTAVLLQVWELTHNPVWTGAIGLATGVPFLVFGLIGGTLADSMDRRTLVALATTGQLLAALGLAAQALAQNTSVLLLLGLVSALSSCIALGSASRKTFPVRLLPANQVAAGLALQNLAFQAAMLLGPTLAGLVIASRGLTWTYLIQALACLISLLAVVRLPRLPPTVEDEPGQPREGTGSGPPRGGRRRAPRGGWLIIARRPTLWGSFGTDLCATLLAMPISLFPLVNEVRFDGDPRTLGLFLSAVAVGGIGAGLLSGTYTRIPRSGRLQLGAAITWGLALAGFGLAGPLWLVLTCLTVAGAADSVAVVTRAALVQLETPDHFRGRVSSAEHVIGVAGPELGNFRGGLVASLTSAPFALVSGGLLATLLIGGVAAVNRPLRQYRSPDPLSEPGPAKSPDHPGGTESSEQAPTAR